jgi:hypothetical protein
MICPGCGLPLSRCKELINELSLYTLSLQDEWFIHQLVVDTYAAQHVTSDQKPIAGSFALIGLYLVYEKGFTGKQVQRVHMQIARKQKIWPKFIASTTKWELTVEDVMKTPVGEKRDEMIRKWGKSVWQIWQQDQEQQTKELLATFGIF